MDHFTFLLIYYCRSDDHWVVWRAANEHKVALKKLETMGTITVEEAVKEIRRRSMKLISAVPEPAPLADQVRKFSFATYQPKKVYYIILDFQPQRTAMCYFTAVFVNLQYSRLV